MKIASAGSLHLDLVPSTVVLEGDVKRLMEVPDLVSEVLERLELLGIRARAKENS